MPGNIPERGCRTRGCHHFAIIRRHPATLSLPHAHFRALKCKASTRFMENAMQTTRKVIADFSLATALAALIGIVVGGGALSLVWLVHVLNR